MVHQAFWLTTLIWLLLASCTSRRSEESLRRKEAELNQREQQLVLKETTLNLRELELNRRAQELDSVEMTLDSAQIVRPELVGHWSVRMTCTETSCPGSAVGDTKTEHWELGYRSGHVVAKALVSDRLVRVYSGLFRGNTLELIEHRDSTSMTYDTRMVVRLQLRNSRTMEGYREIFHDNDCRIVYALRMDKMLKTPN